MWHSELNAALTTQWFIHSQKHFPCGHYHFEGLYSIVTVQDPFTYCPLDINIPHILLRLKMSKIILLFLLNHFRLSWKSAKQYSSFEKQELVYPMTGDCGYLSQFCKVTLQGCISLSSTQILTWQKEQGKEVC